MVFLEGGEMREGREKERRSKKRKGDKILKGQTRLKTGTNKNRLKVFFRREGKETSRIVRCVK